MNNNEVPQAERTNLLREDGSWTFPGQPKSGGKPRPIRKKAFWRALKRGELWALVPYSWQLSGGALLKVGNNQFARVITVSNCPTDRIYCLWPIDGVDVNE